MSGYEKLRNPIADMIYELNVDPDEAVAIADRILALIAERTKEATRSQLDAYWGGPENCQPRELADRLAAAAWRDQHAASALYPPALPTQAQQMEGDR